MNKLRNFNNGLQQKFASNQNYLTQKVANLSPTQEENPTPVHASSKV